MILSRDLEDVLLLMDGRAELAGEIMEADAEVRSFIARQVAALMAHPDYDHFLQGNVRGPEGRADIVHDRLLALAQAGG